MQIVIGGKSIFVAHITHWYVEASTTIVIHLSCGTRIVNDYSGCGTESMLKDKVKELDEKLEEYYKKIQHPITIKA